MFTKILFPTDGSPASQEAAMKLSDIMAKADVARVTLAVAFTPIDPSQSDYEPAAVEKHNEYLRREAGIYLGKAAEVFEARGIATSYRILTGKPISRVLASEAENGGYDAVVMGSRGMGMEESDDNYLGSVTEHLIRSVSIPVLVIPLRNR